MYKKAQRHGDLGPTIESAQGLSSLIGPSAFLRIESHGLGGAKRKKRQPSLRKFSWDQEASTSVSANVT